MSSARQTLAHVKSVAPGKFSLAHSDRGARQRKYPKELCATDEIDPHLNTISAVWVYLKGERRSWFARDSRGRERAMRASFHDQVARYTAVYSHMEKCTFWITHLYVSQKRFAGNNASRLAHPFQPAKEIDSKRTSITRQCCIFLNHLRSKRYNLGYSNTR